MNDRMSIDEEEHLQECIDEVSGLVEKLNEAGEALNDAMTVEKMGDFKANLVEAKKVLEGLVKEIDEVLAKAADGE